MLRTSFFLLPLIALLTTPAATAETPLADRVEQSIAGAAKYILSRQKDDGHWRCDATQGTQSKNMKAGQTAQAVYALLAGDVSVHDKRIEKALDWLIANPEPRTYTLGFAASAMAIAARKAGGEEASKYQQCLEKYIRVLCASVSASGHPYVLQDSMGSLSNDHIGALGLWAGVRNRIEVPINYWRFATKHWTRLQKDDGGWPYLRGKDKRTGFANDKKSPSVSMTAGGLATLYVCNDILNAEQFLGCGGNEISPAIRKGLGWMEKNYGRLFKKNHGERMITYTLYAVERTALACGYRSFGGYDWYKTGCEYLFRNQRKDGAFITGPKGKFRGNTYVAPTAFALLFLVRGRQPVALSKLRYNGDWNNRPRAMAYLTRWMSREFEQDFNWQIIRIDTDVNNWHDSPALVITGSRKPDFSDEHIEKLRRYVYQGGMILSVAECAGKPFGDGMIAAYKKMFPDYRLLDVDKHELRTKDVLFDIRKNIPLQMIYNGARPLAIHIPDDLARFWQLNRPLTAKDQFRIAANLVRYAGGAIAALPRRGTMIWPGPKKFDPAASISVMRLKHGGNHDPEPLAWQRFSRLMGGKYKIAVDVTGPFPAAELAAAKPDLAVITGTGKLAFSPEDRKHLASFVKGGGTLFVDAAGGDKPFTLSAIKTIDALFDGARLRPMAASEKLFAAGGMKIERFRYRSRTANDRGGSLRLQAVRLDGRNAVIFSEDDVTTALTGCGSYAVYGFDPDSAFALMRNVVAMAGGIDNVEKPGG